MVTTVMNPRNSIVFVLLDSAIFPTGNITFLPYDSNVLTSPFIKHRALTDC